MNQRRPFIFITLVSIAAAHAFSADKPWENSSELSYVNTTGNTRTETFGLKNKFEYDWDKTALRTKAEALTARENKQTTAENYLAEEKFEWKYVKPNYLFQLGKWERDRFAGIDSRLTAGAGVGRQLLRTERQKLTSEIGVQHSWEDQKGGDYKKFGSARAFGDYVLKMTETAEFEQNAEFIKDFDQSDAFRVKTLTSLKAKMNAHLALKTSYEVKYDNDPPPSTAKTDTITTIALVADF